MLTKLRWGWIVAGAFLLELILVVTLVPLIAYFGLQKMKVVVVVVVLALSYLIGRWIAGKVRVQTTVHGILVGALATGIYVGMCMTAPGGIAAVAAEYGMTLFVAANGARVVACALGGSAYRGDK